MCWVIMQMIRFSPGNMKELDHSDQGCICPEIPRSIKWGSMICLRREVLGRRRYPTDYRMGHVMGSFTHRTDHEDTPAYVPMEHRHRSAMGSSSCEKGRRPGLTISMSSFQSHDFRCMYERQILACGVYISARYRYR